MLNPNLILDRLEGVADRGAGRWVARCPAHEDRHPSLSIVDAGDKLLLKCFAECETAAVLAAIGLDWSDLYPPRPVEIQHRKAPPKPFTDRDLLLLLTQEGMVAVLACTKTILSGKLPSPDETVRLDTARQRIERVMEVM
jgi:hypothetical protein